MKRALDLALAGTLLVLCAPAMLLCALAIKVGDGGPILFLQKRVGRGGREFLIWKFRSMRVDAERLGPSVTSAGDPRITRVGRFLRATKLDELPQFVNVLLGEMSLVGPRPEVPKYVGLYDDAQRRVLDGRPGMTDPASLRFFDEGELLAQASDPHAAYVERLMPYKLRINLAYAQRATALTDLVVVAATALRLIGVRWSGAPFVRLPDEPLILDDPTRRAA